MKIEVPREGCPLEPRPLGGVYANDNGARCLASVVRRRVFCKTLLCTLGRWNELAATDE